MSVVIFQETRPTTKEELTKMGVVEVKIERFGSEVRSIGEHCVRCLFVCLIPLIYLIVYYTVSRCST